MTKPKGLSKLTVLAIFMMLLSCIGAFIIVSTDITTIKNAREELDNGIKPGMTRDEVYEQLVAIGSYRVIYLEPRPSQCAPWRPESLYVELFSVRPYSKLPVWGSIDRYLCFDASGTLIDVFDAGL